MHHQGAVLTNGHANGQFAQMMDSSIPPGSLGFSHSAFQSNPNSLVHRRHIINPAVPPINTKSMEHLNEIHTPGLDLNDTRFLPFGLISSPLNPQSPPVFASGAIANYAGFGAPGSVPRTHAHPHGHSHNHTGEQPIAMPAQSGAPPSPTMGMNFISPHIGTYIPGASNSTAEYATMANQPLAGFPNGTLGISSNLLPGTTRTVYLGNIPTDTSAEEILGHVRSGQIESVRLLPDKNCAFISFLDSSSATHFHSDAILKKLSIKGQDIKIGWGKPSSVPSSVSLAVQQSGASRNVYLGNLPDEITEDEIREDLGKYGPIDMVKIVKEKNIAFVHYLSISNAVKAVTQLPQEPKWHPPRRVYYGKDRCAYVSKTQQQNAAQYLGISPGHAQTLTGTEREVISTNLIQQSVAAAAVASITGGPNNVGNRTVYLGNIHPETSIEEICNVVRGGLLHQVKYIPDKHICFVTFIDPTAAASFYALSNMQGLMIHNRRLKIGWGKHSGALPPAIALAVSGGASRNVYIGNLDETWTEERLRSDFAEFGEIELVNTLREKSCAFVNFTNIANAIKSIEAVRQKEDYKRFKVNFGKDRCGNPPRQVNGQNGSEEDLGSQTSGQNGRSSPGNVHQHGNQLPLLNMNNSTNPLVMFLQQTQHQGHQHQPQSTSSPAPAFYAAEPSPVMPLAAPAQPTAHHTPSASYSYVNGLPNGSSSNLANLNGGATVNGLLAPPTRGQHARAVSLPVFAPGQFSQPMPPSPQRQPASHSRQQPSMNSAAFSSAFTNNAAPFGLAIQAPDGTSTLAWPTEGAGVV